METRIISGLTLGNFEAVVGERINGIIVTKIECFYEVIQTSQVYHGNEGWREDYTQTDIYKIYSGNEVLAEVQRGPGLILRYKMEEN